MESKRYATGLVLLGTVVLLWVSSSFLIEDILTKYPKPFFLNYFSVSTFQLYFLGIFVRSWNRHKGNASEKLVVPLTNMETFRLGLRFYLVYFFSSYLSNASFGYTDVLSASVLLSTSSFFTMIMSVAFGLERLTVMKGISVGFSAGAVCVVGWVASSRDQALMISPPPYRLLGNLYAIFSAFLYGIYSVALKKVMVEEERLDMNLFFGIIGFLSTISLWPLFFVFHHTGIEPFELPGARDAGLLAINYIFGTFLANYLWARAVLYTTPMVVAIGLSLCTPLTVVFNVFIKHDTLFNYRSLAGVFIVIGFLIINFSTLYPEFNFFFENQYAKLTLQQIGIV